MISNVTIRTTRNNRRLATYTVNGGRAASFVPSSCEDAIAARVWLTAHRTGGRDAAAVALSTLAQVSAPVSTEERTATLCAPGSRKHPSYLARITGACPRYRFARQFLIAKTSDHMELEVSDGLYEYTQWGEKYYLSVCNGETIKLTAAEAAEIVAAPARGQRPSQPAREAGDSEIADRLADSPLNADY